MTSIIDPLKKESLTTLRIQYNWKRDIVRLEAAKEWESDLYRLEKDVEHPCPPFLLQSQFLNMCFETDNIEILCSNHVLE